MLPGHMYKPIKLVGTTIGKDGQWYDPRQDTAEVFVSNGIPRNFEQPKRDLKPGQENLAGKETRELLEMSVSSQVVYFPDKKKIREEQPKIIDEIVKKDVSPPARAAEASLQSPINICVDTKSNDSHIIDKLEIQKTYNAQELPTDMKLLLSSSTVSSIAVNQEIPDISLSSTAFDTISTLETEPYVIMRKDLAVQDSDEQLYSRMDLLATLVKSQSMHDPLSSLIDGIRPVKSVHPDDTLDEVLAAMLSSSCEVAAVSEDGIITGLVNCHDILALVRQNELQVRRAQRNLHKAGHHSAGDQATPHSALQQPTHLHRVSITSMQGANVGQGPRPLPLHPLPLSRALSLSPAMLPVLNPAAAPAAQRPSGASRQPRIGPRTRAQLPAAGGGDTCSRR